MKSDWDIVAAMAVTWFFLVFLVYIVTTSCDDGRVFVHTDVVRGCVPVTEAVNLK